MTAERHSFQTEAKELLQLMIHSVYSNSDIFLRELISNASDALDKRRIAALKGEAEPEANPEIRISRDPDTKTLSVEDNGIGMNRGEIIEYLGTIAKSGTREFLDRARESDGSTLQEMLIGQFGVGFYSSFMVADKVTVVTRRAGDAQGWRFESTGDGSYTIEETERPEAGTTVTLHLREPRAEEGGETRDYADEWTLRELVRKYSDFVNYPIRMKVTRYDKDHETQEEETINAQTAIWARPESEVTDQEYNDFYRHLTRDWQEPLTRVSFTAEGTVNFRGLLFIPSSAPLPFLTGAQDEGVQLYIKRVFIMNDSEHLIPRYMRFIRGVIDSEDLPLNISREILQEDSRIRVIRRGTLRKIFAALRKMQETDLPRYEKFWSAFGPTLKEGLVQDTENQETLLDLCLFRTTAQEGWTTLREVLGRMKPDQKGIYWLSGGSFEALRASPLIEGLQAKGIEVLLMSDPIDEIAMSYCSKYKDKDFINVAASDVDLLTEEEKKDQESRIADLEKEYAPLLSAFSKALENKTNSVRLSFRMQDSPVCLVPEGGARSFQMEQVFRAMGRDLPETKRVMELNPEHDVVKTLLRLARNDDPQLGEYADVLYDQALIAEGGQIQDVAGFSRRLTALLSRALGESNAS